MDKIDTALIALLRKDARISITQLSGRLGITRATVRAKLDRLSKSGEILGYTVVLKGDAFDLPVRGVM
ncbi:MAG: AsnC family transcriptional regulator, partial [Alphaproteobacteria bacterium]|nr:AsnC family transcriptional regulator [Alphaproteobacteria bacterium]